MSAERLVLLVSGLPQPNEKAMQAARVGLRAAGLEPLDLGMPPASLQAPESHDIPAGVADAEIERFVDANEWIFSEVDGLLVVNRNTELFPVPQATRPKPGNRVPRQRQPAGENMRVTHSVGRVAAALMGRARQTMTAPRSLFVSHALPVRVGEPSPVELAVAAEARISDVTRLKPIPLKGKVEEIDLGSRTR